jgi:hypothetical protein
MIRMLTPQGRSQLARASPHDPLTEVHRNRLSRVNPAQCPRWRAWRRGSGHVRIRLSRLRRVGMANTSLRKLGRSELREAAQVLGRGMRDNPVNDLFRSPLAPRGRMALTR